MVILILGGRVENSPLRAISVIQTSEYYELSTIERCCDWIRIPGTSLYRLPSKDQNTSEKTKQKQTIMEPA